MATFLKPFLLILSLLIFAIAAIPRLDSRRGGKEIGVGLSVSQFRTNSRQFADRIGDLEKTIQKISSDDSLLIQAARQDLKEARLAYKKIEYFLEYFFFTSSRIYNRAPKNEIEEPHLEYLEPAGLQYMEAMLFEDSAGNFKDELLQQCRLLGTASNDLNALLYQFEATDVQIVESIRTELIRVIALGITGFDAPLLKSGIAEARTSIQTLEEILKPYVLASRADSVAHYLSSTIHYLDQNQNFDNFNRLEFLTAHALPLQKQLGIMIRTMGLESGKPGALNQNAAHIFSPDAFATAAFGEKEGIIPAEIELGKLLFSETRLSGDRSKSCASCHNPALAFTDGLAKSVGLHGQNVRRNAPTLLYAAYQHNQFWDGRAKTLEQQIATVIHDPAEMNGDLCESIQNLSKDKKYRKLVRKAYGGRQPLTDGMVYSALTSFIRTLKPFNSDFDRYMQGDKKALTDAQVSGFNLFMGRAQCGTCHFAPLFNGLIPPLYALTEFEVLGTTATELFEKPEMDSDEGRFETRPTPYYRGAFKTPTVRNSAVTAPYMHHGTFGSLETVMEFYDKGGGAGLGLDVAVQTLSPIHLNLSDKDKTDIISFLHALTDHL